MRKRDLIIGLIATAALVALGCDRGGDTVPLGGKPSGLLDDEADDLTSLDDDPDLQPIEVAWTDGAEASDAAVDGFQLEVTNVSDAPVSGSLRLLCSSVLQGGVPLDLGAFALEPGDVLALSVAAADLPIRSSTVLTQAMVEVSRTYKKPGDVEGTVVSVEAPRYYRHDDGFGTAVAFTERQVQDELGGVLFAAPSDLFATKSAPTEDAAEEAVLGEVSDGAGGFDAVTMASEGIALRAEDGTIYAYVTGASFGVEEPPDIEPTPTEEAAEEEEVSYE